MNFPAQFDLANLDGSNGFVLNGIDEGDRAGISVSGAGDVNGDGIDDLIIGADRADPNGNRSGESYVVFGSDSGFSATFKLSSLDGSNGFVINGIDELDRSGYSVSGAGDVNGDGFDDLIIGAFGADPNGDLSGESYVVFGTDTGFSAALELSSLDGSNGFVINGISEFDGAGDSVSGAGDVNGDGFDDIIIGDPVADPNGIDSGKSYVVFGSDEGFGAAFELSSLDGSNAFVINGVDGRDYSGYSVSGAGDVNGDGFDDIIIGAPDADPNGDLSGESYVVFGTDAGFDSAFELSNLDGSNGFVINGVREFDRSGFSVSSAGDVNGDGFDDLIVGAPEASYYVGESYMVFGSDTGFDASLELSNLDGSNGFVIKGIQEYDQLGYSVSGAGDVNGDGFDDLIIGSYASFEGSVYSGGSYVIFGTDEGFNAALELSSLNGSNGFVLNAPNSSDGLGRSVSGAGDVNGDGFDDLIIGAPDTYSGSVLPGASYVVFGAANSETLIGTDGNNVLIGGKGNDVLNGKAGNDVLDGDEGNDSLFGGNDADILIGGDGNDSLFGEQGFDTLYGGNGKDTLYGGNGKDTLIGGNGNDILKGDVGKDTLIGGNGNDTLKGEIGKDTLIGGNGSDILTGGDGRDTFVLMVGEGTDTITDFSAQDRIGLAGGLGIGDLSFVGNDILLTNTNEVLATLSGIDTTSLSSNQFVLL